MVYNKDYYEKNKDNINELARLSYSFQDYRREYYKKFENPTQCECGDFIKNEKWIKYHIKTNKHINNLKLQSIDELTENLDLVLKDNIIKEQELLEKNEKLDKLIIKPLQISELSYRKRKY
jgi:hypothetical protein